MSLQRHLAPGAIAGFSYQFERALYWLAQSPAGATIGIETGDDVSVQRGDGTLLWEQDKNSNRKGGKPFGDRSKDLWNTLTIWLDAIEEGQVTKETTAFLMVTNNVLPKCIAKQIDRADSEKSIEACIRALEKSCERPPIHISHLVKRVLRSESRDTLRALIAKVNLADASGATAGPELRRKTLAHLQVARLVFVQCRFHCG